MTKYRFTNIQNGASGFIPAEFETINFYRKISYDLGSMYCKEVIAITKPLIKYLWNIFMEYISAISHFSLQWHQGI